MGEIADSIINGEFDMYTGEYLGEPCGYPRTKNNKKQKKQYYKTVYVHLTPSEKKIASIRKEIAILVSKGTSIEDARRQINEKYGKGWRERGLISNSDNQWSEEDLREFIK